MPFNKGVPTSHCLSFPGPQLVMILSLRKGSYGDNEALLYVCLSVHFGEKSLGRALGFGDFRLHH